MTGKKLDSGAAAPQIVAPFLQVFLSFKRFSV